MIIPRRGKLIHMVIGFQHETIWLNVTNFTTMVAREINLEVGCPLIGGTDLDLGKSSHTTFLPLSEVARTKVILSLVRERVCELEGIEDFIDLKPKPHLSLRFLRI